MRIGSAKGMSNTYAATIRLLANKKKLLLRQLWSGKSWDARLAVSYTVSRWQCGTGNCVLTCWAAVHAKVSLRPVGLLEAVQHARVQLLTISPNLNSTTNGSFSYIFFVGRGLFALLVPVAVLWIRIRIPEFCGSGSVCPTQIWIHTCNYRINLK